MVVSKLYDAQQMLKDGKKVIVVCNHHGAFAFFDGETHYATVNDYGSLVIMEYNSEAQKVGHAVEVARFCAPYSYVFEGPKNAQEGGRK